MENPSSELDDKRFALEIWSGKKRFNLKRIPPVTIVTAIAGKDGIIMASDSRTTDEDSKIRDDTKKVHTIQLAENNGFLIGQSGNDDLGTRAIEIISQLAKGATLKDYRSCADLAQSAIAQLKQEIREQFKGTSEEFQRHLEHHGFDLLLAHYYRDEPTDGRLRAPIPHIFSIRFALGMARIHRNKFVSIGCGAPIADFILDGFDISNLDFSQTVATAVYCVNQVKKFDPRCGGRTQVAVAEKVFFESSNSYMTPAVELHDDLVDDFTQATAEIEKEFSALQHKMMNGIMDKMKKYVAPRIEKAKAESGGFSIGAGGKIGPYTPPPKH